MVCRLSTRPRVAGELQNDVYKTVIAVNAQAHQARGKHRCRRERKLGLVYTQTSGHRRAEQSASNSVLGIGDGDLGGERCRWLGDGDLGGERRCWHGAILHRNVRIEELEDIRHLVHFKCARFLGEVLSWTRE